MVYLTLSFTSHPKLRTDLRPGDKANFARQHFSNVVQNAEDVLCGLFDLLERNGGALVQRHVSEILQGLFVLPDRIDQLTDQVQLLAFG